MAPRASVRPPAGSGGVPLRVLILESEPTRANLMVRALRRAGFAPDGQRVQTEPDFLARLVPTLDLILADWRPPQVDAARLLQLMKDRGLDIPFIVLGEAIEEDAAVSIMKQGAADCLRSDHWDRLGEVVHRALERKGIETTIRTREAYRANRAKSEFLSRMSQELRTPLNAMLGFAQMLEVGTLSPDQRESVDRILKAGRHLVELIDEVLEISHLEGGQMAMSLEPVPVSEPVQEALSLIAPLAAKANIRLRVEAAGGPQRYIVADRQRVKQVLVNLLSNAVKYNRPGGSVTVSSEDAPQGRLRIKVSDTGRGISPEKLNRLFTPFDRLGAEQTEIEGTGLGLPLCKRLVEAMGGTLGVESVEGRGSTFWVELVRGEGGPALR